MSFIQELRALRDKAIKALGAKEAIESESVYKTIEEEIAEIDAKLARASAAQARAAAQARPATGHAENEAQQGVEGYDVDPEVERLATERAYLRGVAGMSAAYDRNTELAHERFERALKIVRASGIKLPPKEKRFASLGEQLQAVATHYTSQGLNTDARLVRAPTGAGEVDPTGGGFLVQVDFVAAIYMIAHDMGNILGAVNKIPIGEKFNGIKIPGVDETSRATGSRWGGVQSYWIDEGTGATPTKPKFRLIEWSLHKLASFFWMTDELLQDAGALTAVMSQAFSEEVMFMTEDAVFEGSGAGLPLGILPKANGATAPAGNLLSGLSTYASGLTDAASYLGPVLILPSVKGQPSQSVVKQNIDQMWARVWPRSRANGVWLINQDVETQLLNLNQPVGTGGVGGTMVYMPPGGMSAKPFGEIYGRPVITTEYNPGLGRPGDIMFADLTQYTLADKGGVQFATSMHVAFLSDQMVFRITYRVDGKPMWTVPMAPFAAASLYKSPFVALASR